MSYIDKNLLPDEQILFRTRKSLIIFFFVGVGIAIAATFYMHTNPILVKVIWIPWLLAAFFVGKVWLEYITSEFVITNKRVMMREGFFIRHANQLRLDTISQVNVEQSLLGQLFNYGIVSINTFGAYDAYPMISQPFAFQKNVNGQVDRLK